MSSASYGHAKYGVSPHHSLALLQPLVIVVSLLLVTAFAVVYTKDINRRLFIHYQEQQAMQQTYNVQWGKLLLEQSAWSTQSRIQNIAENQLSMVMPNSRDVVMVQAQPIGSLTRPLKADAVLALR